MGQRHSRTQTPSEAGPRKVASSQAPLHSLQHSKSKDLADLPPSLGFHGQAKATSSDKTATPMSSEKLEALWQRLFGLGAEEEDVIRWLSSRFLFVGSDASAATIQGTDEAELPCPWGLRQEQGGPCGVLAAMQAYIVKELLWGSAWTGTDSCCLSRSSSASSTIAGTDCESEVTTVASESVPGSPSDSPRAATQSRGCADVAAPSQEESPSASEGLQRRDVVEAVERLSLETLLDRRFASVDQQELLVCAVVAMLHTAAPVSQYVWAAVSDRQNIACTTFKSAAALAHWLLEERVLEACACPVMSFVCSLILTRGLSQLEDDMDDVMAPLVGRFGHCSQELVNLCLTGRASTNVFDGDLAFGEGADTLTLKGVSSNPEVGFLSAMEPLRLCEVGQFLKRPRYPLWVVGGSSHYTLLLSWDCCRTRVPLPKDGACSCCAKSCEVCLATANRTKCVQHDNDGRTASRFLHYNGSDLGGARPTLLPLDVNFAQCSSGLAYEAKILPQGDQDTQLFAELVRSSWPGAEVLYPRRCPRVD
mmetsp:Transcript_26172/g.61041  ORF Transcript_26172/g.61041 Transcript_26172/m.61041 type:complete len:536 (+) Transcript_26172:114-1721(+)